MFSDLNQLNDISMKPPYATVCGITQQELVNTFTPEITRLGEQNELSFDETVAKLTAMYDGYHFGVNTPGMFNPFSLLNVFDGEGFDNYWFQTGTPTYLADLLKQSDYDLRLLMDGVEVGASAFSEYRADTNNPLPMIYQSGYLTIKDYDKEVKLYTLGFPNNEVRYGFLEFLLLTTFRPVLFSNSLNALPAMFPPSLATILLSSKPCGFSVLLISVVANSPNMLITNSALVMLSRRFSFFNPLIRLCSPVVIPKDA